MAVAPTSESKGPIVSTLVTSTWRAQLEAGDSQGSVKRTTWQPWCGGDPGALDRVRLVAAVVEHDQDVALPEVDQLLSGRGPVGVDDADVRPEQVELVGEVAGELAADPPAEDEHPAAGRREQLDDLLEVALRDQLLGGLQVGAGHLEDVGEEGVRPPPGRASR